MAKIFQHRQRIEVLQVPDSETIRIAKEKLKKVESNAYGKAQHGVALNNLASALVSEGKYLEAKNAYKEAISISELVAVLCLPLCVNIPETPPLC